MGVEARKDMGSDPLFEKDLLPEDKRRARDLPREA
jgi:hypothetical protein